MPTTTSFPTVRALDQFTADLGVSATTVWKWRKQGILKTHNLHGKNFISAAEAERFIQRLESGEFSRDKKVPPPPRARRKAQEGSED